MYKNQLQELAQRSCFNLPTYAYVREGPDHAPRFKATVNFNGETFESPTFCTTLRQAEHSAAEVALSTLSKRGPSRFLAAKVLDETGVYKNLLQETSQRAGLNLPVYTTIRSGPGHVPVFSCTVELGRMSFTGEPAKTKKQAQKNAAMAAWSALRQMSYQGSSSSSAGLESEGNEEQEQVVVARTLATLCPAETNSSTQNDRHRGHRRIAPIRRPTKSASRNISLYPMQYQRNYSKPEIAIYQMWPQEEASQKKNCMLTTPIAPISPPVPRVVQSILQPEHGQYVSARDQERIQPVPAATVSMSEPSFFSNPLVPTAVASRTQVAKQEIKVEGTQTGDANGNVRKVNTQSNVSGIFPFEAPKDPVSGDSQAEVFLQETKQELDKQKNVDSDPSIMHPVQLEGGQSGHFEWTAHGSMDAGHEVRATNRGQAEFQWHQLQGHGFSQSPKSHHPSQISPVMVRDVRVPSTKASVRFPTVGPALPASSSVAKVPASAGLRTPFPACAPRPWQRGMIAGRVPSNMMAPAVQIRSVVPVCAAPPAKEVPDAGQHGFLPVAVEGSHLPKDVKVASLELGKLQI